MDPVTTDIFLHYKHLPVVLLMLSLVLLVFFVLKKWIEKRKALKIAERILSRLEIFARKSPALWDDVLVKVLKGVVSQLGVLSSGQEKAIKKLVDKKKQEAKKEEK